MLFRLASGENAKVNNNPSFTDMKSPSYQLWNSLDIIPINAVIDQETGKK